MLNELRLRSALRVAWSIDGTSFSDYTLKAVEACEPHVLWNYAFLKNRRDCFEHLKLPAAAAARRDWEAFLNNEPPKLDLDEEGVTHADY